MTFGPRLYPLAPSIWGEAVELPVDNVVQAPLFAEFAGRRGTSFVPVHLQPNPLTGTWRVRRLNQDGSQGPTLGEVARERREAFSDVRRVEASLLMPATLAQVRMEPETGQFNVTVLLPAPELAVPRNDTPDAAAVLPPGDMVVVDTAKGEYTADELAARSPGQWFVALHPIGGSVAATLGDKVLGGFDPDEAAALAEFIAGAKEPVYARAVLLDGMAALDIAGPEEGVQRVPALQVPDTRPMTPWAIVNFPDGTWAVTVERDFATDPADTVKPRHTARYVSLAGGERPANLEAPTEMFGAVVVEKQDADTAGAEKPKPLEAQTAKAAWSGAGDYLTEVEKVRVRRAARVAGEGGRHRR